MGLFDFPIFSFNSASDLTLFLVFLQQLFVSHDEILSFMITLLWLFYTDNTHTYVSCFYRIDHRWPLF